MRRLLRGRALRPLLSRDGRFEVCDDAAAVARLRLRQGAQQGTRKGAPSVGGERCAHGQSLADAYADDHESESGRDVGTRGMDVEGGESFDRGEGDDSDHCEGMRRAVALRPDEVVVISCHDTSDGDGAAVLDKPAGVTTESLIAAFNAKRKHVLEEGAEEKAEGEAEVEAQTSAEAKANGEAGAEGEDAAGSRVRYVVSTPSLRLGSSSYRVRSVLSSTCTPHSIACSSAAPLPRLTGQSLGWMSTPPAVSWCRSAAPLSSVSPPPSVAAQ